MKKVMRKKLSRGDKFAKFTFANRRFCQNLPEIAKIAKVSSALLSSFKVVFFQTVFLYLTKIFDVFNIFFSQSYTILNPFPFSMYVYLYMYYFRII